MAPNILKARTDSRNAPIRPRKKMIIRAELTIIPTTSVLTKLSSIPEVDGEVENAGSK